MGDRPAERERRMGRFRCRQHERVSEPHPVRRSRCAARSADGGRHGALREHACAAWSRVERGRAGRGLAFLRRCQEKDGSWFGRWGMNYVYGTWSVLCALAAAKVKPDAPEIRRAVAWLRSTQNEDGGWGEGGDSYSLDYRGHQRAPSTPSQTAWALLGLMAAGEARSGAVARGIEHLLARQDADGFWPEPQFTATGFPRVFYLRYHGYAKFFPLWALARYRNLIESGERSVRFGL